MENLPRMQRQTSNPPIQTTSVGLRRQTGMVATSAITQSVRRVMRKHEQRNSTRRFRFHSLQSTVACIKDQLHLAKIGMKVRVISRMPGRVKMMWWSSQTGISSARRGSTRILRSVTSMMQANAQSIIQIRGSTTSICPVVHSSQDLSDATATLPVVLYSCGVHHAMSLGSDIQPLPVGVTHAIESLVECPKR